MGSHFDRWEKDPFFNAAEEVQESADRMESIYRTWVHSKKDPSGMWNSDELRRDLRTALGTAKWQLEEFERAVKSSYANSSVDDAKDRHSDFVVAMESQISKVEASLRKSAVPDGKPPMPWVHLNEGESKELALFLSGPTMHPSKQYSELPVRSESAIFSVTNGDNTMIDSSKDLVSSSDSREEKLPGHRRTASAGADIGSWKIAVADDVFAQNSSNEHPEPPPRRIPSFSGLLNTMESASKLKWSKNGYRKLKNVESHQQAEDTLPESQPLANGIHTCYERSKSCLDGCDDCDKQLYGWYGAVQRLLQRSQYQMQYSRPLQVVSSVLLLLFLIVLFVMRAV